MLQGNNDKETMALWNSNRLYRAPLAAIKLLRIALGAALVSYVLGHTVHWIGVLGIFVVLAIIFNIVFSRRLRKQGDIMEKTFNDNLTQREQGENDPQE